jgi:hypothetical protein
MCCAHCGGALHERTLHSHRVLSLDPKFFFFFDNNILQFVEVRHKRGCDFPPSKLEILAKDFLWFFASNFVDHLYFEFCGFFFLLATK